VNDDLGAAGGGASIAVDASGNAYAVWRDARNISPFRGPDIYFAYRPTGGDWGPNVRVNDDEGDAYQWAPSIAVDSEGNAYAVWSDPRNWIDYERDIYFSYRPAGGSWEPNERVNDDAGMVLQDYPSIAVDGAGNAYAVWGDDRNGSDDPDVYFSYRPAGGTWGANVRVNDDAGTATQGGASIAVDASGNAYAVWGDCRNGSDDPDVYFSYRPAGGAWGANVRVNDDAGTASQGLPAIAVDAAGNAYAVWQDDRNGMSGGFGDVYFSYKPAGGQWAANVRVNDAPGTASPRFPDIAVDGSGNAYATWSDIRNVNNDNNLDIYFSYRPAGGSWRTNERINDDSGTAFQAQPVMAADPNGNAYAAWWDKRNGGDNDDVYFSYRPGEAPTCERGLAVLVHGWGGSAASFGQLPTWLEEDGYCSYVADNITEQKTLADNAQILREEIIKAKGATGVDKVIIIAHSLGGIITRAYVESDLYQKDVQRVFIFGSPNAGSTLATTGIWVIGYWPLAIACDRTPALCEITIPAMLRFNAWHSPRSAVPYYLIAGDAPGEIEPFSFVIRGGDDRLVGVIEVHGLSGSQVWKYLTPDRHSIREGERAYFDPKDTYDDCVRPRLYGQSPTNCNLVGDSFLAPVGAGTSSPLAQAPPFIGTVTTGQTITHTMPIDVSGMTQFTLMWTEGDLDLTLVDPTNRLIDPAVAEVDPDIDFEEVPGTDGLMNAEAYTVANTPPGLWTLNIEGIDTAGSEMPFLALVIVDSLLSLEVTTDQDWYPQGQSAHISASLSDESGGVSGATVNADIVKPDGITDTLALYDDGIHGDGVADDGVYANDYPGTSMGGYYAVLTTAAGSWQSESFERGAETAFTVSPATALLSGDYSDYPEDADGNGRYEHLVLEVGVDASVAGDFTVSALLVDGNGEPIDNALGYTTLVTGTNTVSLYFDGDAIRDHGKDGPWTIADVYLADSSGAAIQLDEAHDVLTTIAYDHDTFGNDWLVYLPLIMKSH